jgi:prepilin-type N-terminal cleavage/methylation domain-containing protein
MKKLRNNFGFTMMELLIVMSIIGILSSSVFLNWKKGEEGFALQNSAHKLLQNIRETQEMAMGAKEVNCGGSEEYGFGIYFSESLNPDSYIIFADCDNDGRWISWIDEKIKEVDLEENIRIYDVFPSLWSFFPLHLVFSPPDPSVSMLSGFTTYGWGTEAVITLRSDSGQQKEVRVNMSGMIEIK